MRKMNDSLTECNWHAYSSTEAIKAFQTHSSGLDDKQVEHRLKQYGPNHLPQTAKKHGFVRFLLQFHNILIYVLLGAAAVTALLQHTMDTVVILAVVIVNAMIGFIQENKAEKALDAIRSLLSPSATVLRNNIRQTVQAETLVPGDIVLLEAGDKVPADLRLFKTHGLIIDESILTGESIPVEKHTQSVSADAPLGDRSCMAYSGTLITRGQGKGVVVATGKMTEIGRISRLLSKVEVLTTPLVQQMGQFSKWLTLFILLIAALIFVYGYFIQHYDFIELFMIVVGLSVAAIPEGLPAVLSITLAVGVQAMARRHTIVRRLPSIETLGSVSVICTDKTGTLTRNEMMVASVVTAQNRFTIEGAGYAPAGLFKLNETTVENAQYPVLINLAQAAMLCNDSALHEQDGNWMINGDPMEGALLALAAKAGLSITEEQRRWTRTDTIPFDARHRFMATLHHNQQDEAFIFLKGAPEQVLSRCNKQQLNGTSEPLNETYWSEQIEAIATHGQRVLAIAVKTANPEQTTLSHEDVERDLTFLGITGMIDPPRDEVIDAVTQCMKAGIQVKMITGDHVTTARAIGRTIGLKNPDKALTGVALDQMSDVELARAVSDINIFARTSPEHKLRLVMALQSEGMTVAMTGDGVNDSLALKRADAGIAMGKKGNDVSREVSDFILTDDNFASIVAAVQEGRTVYDNLKKVISWTLPTNAGESMTIILAILMGLSLPITPIQILWINLITATTLGLALAFEPTEAHTMRRPPRPRNEPILTGELVWHMMLVSVLFVWAVFGMYSYAMAQGYSIELARTIALNTLVVMEIFHLFYIRNIYGTSLNWKAMRGTRVVWLCIIVITLAQFAITYLPPLQAIFATESVPLFDGILIIMIGVTFFSTIEIEKQLRLRLQALHV